MGFKGVGDLWQLGQEKAGLFLLSGGWLAKCLVLAAAQLSLFSACAVT